MILRHFLKQENSDTTNITSFFNNKTNLMITDLVFQVAVLKHLKLTMNPINSNKINSGSRGEVTQVFNPFFSPCFFEFFFLVFPCWFHFFCKNRLREKRQWKSSIPWLERKESSWNSSCSTTSMASLSPKRPRFPISLGGYKEKKENLNKNAKKIMRKNK